MSDDRPSVYREGDLLVVRASAVGGCLWELIATGQGLDPLPFPEKILDAFAAGHEWEPKVLARLRALDWTLDDDAAQREGNLHVGPGRVVRYHPDEIGASHVDGVRRVIEVKALAASTWEKAKRHGVASTYKEYAWQLSTMMHGERLPGVWVVANKDTGELYFEFVDRPPCSLAQIVKRVAEIAEGVAGEPIAQTGRPCEQPDQYPCRFIHLRPEPEKAPEDVATLTPETGPRWLHAVANYAELQRLEVKLKKEKKACRDALWEVAREGRDDDEPTPTIIDSEYVVRWKQSPRRTLDRAAMEADGIEVAKYEQVTVSESISVEVVS